MVDWTGSRKRFERGREEDERGKEIYRGWTFTFFYLLMSWEKLLRRLRKKFHSRLFPHLWNSLTSSLPPFWGTDVRGKKELRLLPPSFFSYVLDFLPFYVHRPTCHHHPFPLPAPAPSTHLTSFPLFHLLYLSLTLSLSLSLRLSQQTFSDSLSCKLGCLSSLISKHVSLPLRLLYLPIQPTLGLNWACSLCVKNKSSSAHFRVKWDYLATAFISFLPLFLVLHS